MKISIANIMVSSLIIGLTYFTKC